MMIIPRILCSAPLDQLTRPSAVQTSIKNVLYYVHENILILIDLLKQQWSQICATKNKPDLFDTEIMLRIKRYRKVRRGDHTNMLKQNCDMIVTQLKRLVGETIRFEDVPAF